MASGTVRSTLYIDTTLHQALRLRAATAHRTMSDLVNEAIRAALQEDDNLATLPERGGEEPLSYESLLARLSADLRPAVRCKMSADALVERWRHLPRVDPNRFRADVDSAIDSALLRKTCV
jgi:plasmid stability protein